MSTPHERAGTAITCDDLRTVHEDIEVASWPAWLRFSLEDLVAYQRAHPEGQVIRRDASGRPVAMLATTRIQWSGAARDLTTWDSVSLVAGPDSPFDPRGNTLVLLSSAVRPDQAGTGIGTSLVRMAQAIAARYDIQHLVGPFRPSGFGAAKAARPELRFEHYCEARRSDGAPLDAWLRRVTALGMQPLRIEPRAMVVETRPGEFDELRRSEDHLPWTRVSDPEVAAIRAAEHGEPHTSGTEVWECGETGSWFVEEDRARYVEANLWGRLPIPDPDGRDEPSRS